MPFPMTHLCIAYNILNNTSQIKNPCDFMLGALAPDSVHFRDNYESGMKKVSHLCMGDKEWGQETNNQEWIENVLTFLQENKHMENSDFMYGYCSHIVADIQNNIKIWTPFRLENSDALEKGAGSVYHQESYAMDYELYLLHPQRKIIWQMLEDATSYNIVNIVMSNEIDKMKDAILHSQFMDRESTDLSHNKYVTLSKSQEFISVESEYIGRILYQNE